MFLRYARGWKDLNPPEESENRMTLRAALILLAFIVAVVIGGFARPL